MSRTTDDPQRLPLVRAEEGVYVDLVYSLRSAGSSRFGPPITVPVMDAVYVGRRDVEQTNGPEIALPEGDTQTSRFHGVFVLGRAVHLSLVYHDLGSENGTSIAGEPIRECPVVAGTTLRLGRSEGRAELRVEEVIATRPDPASYWPERRYGLLRGESAPLRRMFAELDRVAREAQASPVVVVRGPSGAGKKAVAWELLRCWEGRPLNEIPYLDGRWLSAAPDQHELSSLLQADAPALCVDKIHGLSLRHQSELCEYLQERLLAGTPSPRVLILLDHRDAPPHEPDLRDRALIKLLRTVPQVRLPSAESCGADEVEAFARHFLRRYKDEAPPGCRFRVDRCELATETIAALRGEAWPGNWRQLQAAIEVAALSVAIDGREWIEATDLRPGYSEFNLPLAIVLEMPLPVAEEIFRRTYLMWKFRKWAGNLSWVAQEAEFTRRGLLKTAKEIGLHDGEQIVWPQQKLWSLVNPQRQREDQRIRVSLPSSMLWLPAIARSGGDAEAARAHLLELLRRHAAAVIEAELSRQLRREECSAERLARDLGRSRSRRS